jgi:hypothetical protein
MPTEEPLPGQRFVVSPGGIEGHLHDPVDPAVRRLQPADVYTEPPGERGTDPGHIEDYPLDLARHEYFLGQGLQLRFSSQAEAERFHAA